MRVTSAIQAGISTTKKRSALPTPRRVCQTTPRKRGAVGQPEQHQSEGDDEHGMGHAEGGHARRVCPIPPVGQFAQPFHEVLEKRQDDERAAEGNGRVKCQKPTQARAELRTS